MTLSITLQFSFNRLLVTVLSSHKFFKKRTYRIENDQPETEIYIKAEQRNVSIINFGAVVTLTQSCIEEEELNMEARQDQSHSASQLSFSFRKQPFWK